MYEWMIVYEAMTQVSHRPNILAYSYTSGVGGQGGHCPPPLLPNNPTWGGPGPANNRAVYYSILLWQKTDSLDLKENAQEIIQTNERRQAFFDKYN